MNTYEAAFNALAGLSPTPAEVAALGEAMAELDDEDGDSSDDA